MKRHNRKGRSQILTKKTCQEMTAISITHVGAVIGALYVQHLLVRAFSTHLAAMKKMLPG